MAATIVALCRPHLCPLCDGRTGSGAADSHVPCAPKARGWPDMKPPTQRRKAESEGGCSRAARQGSLTCSTVYVYKVLQPGSWRPLGQTWYLNVSGGRLELAYVEA